MRSPINTQGAGSEYTNRALRRRGGIWPSFGAPRHSRLAYHALCSVDRVLLQSVGEKRKKGVNCKYRRKVRALRIRTIIACQVGFLTMYASSVGLFLLYHGFCDGECVWEVGALTLDGGCCDCGGGHGLVFVGRGKGWVYEGRLKDFCWRGGEGWR